MTFLIQMSSKYMEDMNKVSFITETIENMECKAHEWYIMNLHIILVIRATLFSH